MEHYTLSDELRKQLLENAAWGKADITPRLDEEASCDTKPAKGKKGKKGEGEGEGDDAEKKKKKMDGYEHTEVEDGEGAEELAEDLHVCPLCTSQLSEAIDEDALLEHLDMVTALMDRLSQLQEGDEDIEEVINQTILSVATGDLEDE
tara:strand:+ start:173 stop:616 length:444 start_codon:yes stop_codon:yes gene_type:complete